MLKHKGHISNIEWGLWLQLNFTDFQVWIVSGLFQVLKYVGMLQEAVEELFQKLIA